MNEEQELLGERAPVWVNDMDVTRCQNCNNRFRSTIFSQRRHHCRSCGRCVCNECSGKRLSLPYCKNDGEVRICDACYTHFTGLLLNKNSSIWPKPTREIDQTILFGDFRPLNSNTVVWISLQEDFQLHVYGAKLDEAEDFSIRLPELLDYQFEADTRTFSLRETTKMHTFILELTHQITYQKHDTLEERMKGHESKPAFYADLWSRCIQLARLSTLPDWYTRKRDSSDSGVSNVG